MKTRAFVLLMPLIVIVLVAIFATQRVVSPQTRLSPTYDDYLTFQRWRPVCPCSSTVTVGQVVQFNLDPGLDMQTNLCGAILTAMTSCRQTPPFCLQSNLSAMLAYGFLVPLNEACGTMFSALTVAKHNIGVTQLPPDLALPDDLASQITTVVTNEFQKLILLQTSYRLTLNTPIYLGVGSTLFDPSWNSTMNTPPNCSCLTQSVQASAPPATFSRGDGFCFFKSAIDNRVNITQPVWNCAAGYNSWYFPIDVFRQPGTWTSIGLDPSLTQFTSPPNRTVFGEAYIAFVDLLLNSSTLFATPLNGLYTYTYGGNTATPTPSYYTLCAPTR